MDMSLLTDLFAAVWFARQDRMGLVMSICIGSAIQVALVVAPLLVILSWLIGSPMTLVFTNPLDLFAIAGTAFIVNTRRRWRPDRSHTTSRPRRYRRSPAAAPWWAARQSSKRTPSSLAASPPEEKVATCAIPKVAVL